ncbi:MAG: amino acid transporter substrate-binding protein [Firmicutes bacterium]|nr:amino acid transporter substrate-binding protein [Bacillota bacterium]
MKKVLAMLLSCGMLLAFLAGCNQTTPPPAEGGDTGNVVTIGIFEPLTGDSGAGGKQEMLGMQYANKLTPTIDIGGETYTIELVSADNGSTTDKAPTAAQQLVSAQAAVILGSYGSAVSIAGSPIFAQAGIPAIGVTCTNPQVTEGNDHYFRICFLDPFQGTVLSSFAIEKFQAKKAYCLAELGNDYDVGLTNYFQKAFEEVNGAGSVISENFPNGNADFSSYLNTAKAQGVDVIFAPTSISYATQIIEQAAALGIDIALMAGDTWDNNKVVEAAQGTNLQVFVSTFYQEGGNTEFDTGFKAFLNADPQMLTNNGGNDMISAVSAMGYDSYYVALEAMKLADSVNPQDIMTALWDVDYTGVSGKITFNEVGDAVRDTAYIKAVDTANNTWVFEKEQGI